MERNPMTEKMKKTKKATKNPEGIKVSKEIAFTLTREEVAAKGEAMANLDVEIGELETQFSEAKKNWAAKIDARESSRRDISAVVHAKKEVRTVETVMVKDYFAKEIQYFFEGEIVERRTMTTEECQAEFDLGKPKKERAPKQALRKTDPVADAHGNGEDIAEVHKLETSRHSKTSAVDGPTRQ
jgi:hypothetical protein